MRDLRDVFVVRRVDDQLVEAGVVGDDRGGVALDVGLGRGLQLLLQLLPLVVLENLLLLQLQVHCSVMQLQKVLQLSQIQQ